MKSMITKIAIVKNNAGIHVRPTGYIIKEALRLNADIKVKANGVVSDLTEHLSLIAMGLEKGHRVEIMVSGINEEMDCEFIKSLFEKEYDFPPRH